MGERALAAARRVIGVRFRLHGRDARGLDCLGLAGLAMRAEGFEGDIPSGYALRGGTPDKICAAIGAAGFVASESCGDLMLLRSGPGQLHFAISTGAGIIHADAMLRRVVERPEVPWPVIGRWRLKEA